MKGAFSKYLLSERAALEMLQNRGARVIETSAHRQQGGKAILTFWMKRNTVGDPLTAKIQTVRNYDGSLVPDDDTPSIPLDTVNNVLSQLELPAYRPL